MENPEQVNDEVNESVRFKEKLKNEIVSILKEKEYAL